MALNFAAIPFTFIYFTISICELAIHMPIALVIKAFVVIVIWPMIC